MKLVRAQNSSNALNNRLSAHANYAKFEINDWIIPKLEIKRDDQVLDIACGNGKQLIPISETINEGGSITGLDISKDLLDEIKSNVERNNVFLKNGSMENIGNEFEDNKFDLILCCFGLYYSKDYKKTITDIYNKLKEGGRCFVCGPIKRNNKELTDIHETFEKLPEEYNMHNNFMESRALPYFETLFGEVKTDIFENPVTFPSKDELLRYWKSYTLFEKEEQNKFEKVIEEIFVRENKFITKKVVMGISARK